MRSAKQGNHVKVIYFFFLRRTIFKKEKHLSWNHAKKGYVKILNKAFEKVSFSRTKKFSWMSNKTITVDSR